MNAPDDLSSLPDMGFGQETRSASVRATTSESDLDI